MEHAMSEDVTEQVRRELVAEINANPGDRAALEKLYGKVWSLEELSAEYVISGFMSPFVVVKRKVDGVVGSMEFQHMPRFYFNFSEDK
jgi:hypothetical protein